MSIFLKYLKFEFSNPSAQQVLYHLAFTVRRGIERPLFDFEIAFRLNTESMINRLMYFGYFDRVFDGLAGAFVGCFAIYKAFFTPPPHMSMLPPSVKCLCIP
jgi:hypothetical protein